MICRERATGGGQLRWRTMHPTAERLDQGAAVGLRVVGRTDLPDLAVHVEERTRKSQGGAPLSSTGLGGELPDAGLGVVIHLWDSCVRLVRAGRRNTLVLVIDVCRCAERLREPVRPI